MSVQTQIDRISGAVSAALAALSEKGVEVPAGTKVDGLAALIAAIEAGGGSGGAEPPIKIAVKTATFGTNATSHEVTFDLSDYGMTLPNFAACLANVSFDGSELKAKNVNSTYAIMQYKTFTAYYGYNKNTSSWTATTFKDGTAFNENFHSPGHNVAYVEDGVIHVRGNTSMYTPNVVAGIEYVFIIAEV